LALSNAGFPAGFRRRRRLFDPPSPGSPWSWNSLKPYRAFGWAFSQDGLHHLYGFPASPGSGPKSLVFRHSVCSRLRQVFRSASGSVEGCFQEPLTGRPNPIRDDKLRDPSRPPGPGILNENHFVRIPNTASDSSFPVIRFATSIVLLSNAANGPGSGNRT
jgi:hypothetical protein